LGIEWDIDANKEIPGGRFTVLIEPNASTAVELGLKIVEQDQRSADDIKAIDQLICLPAPKANTINFEVLFDKATSDADRDSWRGFDEDDRRIYPLREGQLRAIRYDSCRGMEGWTTLCLGLDTFYDRRIESPDIDEVYLVTSLKASKEKYSDAEIAEKLKLARKESAFNWLMIPLTRSIDHLVVHLLHENSELGKILKLVSDKYPGQIEWIRPGAFPDAEQRGEA